LATQTIEFRSAPTQTTTAKLFAVGSDTQVASVTATEATNRKGTYAAAYTDVAAGEYELIAFVGAVSVARWFVTLTLTTATFQVYDKSKTELIAANAVNASSLAADAITEIQSGLATQASVDDLPTNAELATALGTADDAVLAAIATVQSDTNDIQTRLPAALESGRITAVLDSASRLAIWNTLTTETFTADSFGELLIISDGTNGRAVKVTGANHIAADVHDCQADGLSGSTEIAAINTFATRVTTGLVQDGAVYQFTANMLELAPSGGGGSSVNVLPATGIVADRSAGATLIPVVGETISQSITLYRTDGTTAISLSGKTLVIVFETLSGVDVATVASGSITISGASSNIVTFAYPSAVTASERTLRFAIRDAAAPSTLYMQGVCSVVRAPQVDA
jgi:hypothetical protein